MNAPRPASAVRGRVASLDPLRGIAALSVAWFHFSTVILLPGSLAARASQYGWLGVELFFVVSGFVIPYSLWMADYRIGQFGRFLWKRLVRLHPPYLASVALVVALGWLQTHRPGFGGVPFAVAPARLLLHLFTLNGYFHGSRIGSTYEWLNPAYWTLAIELQFYVAIGLLYSWFVHSRSRGWSVLIAAGISAAVSSMYGAQASWIFYSAPVFLAGVTLFQHRIGVLPTGRAAATLVVLMAAAAATTSIEVTVATAISTGAVLAWNPQNSRIHRVLTWLGQVSYSLYLIHAPIGGRFLAVLGRYELSQPARIAAALFACVLSLMAAWFFARLIEYPSQRWSARIKLNGPEQRERAVIDGSTVLDLREAERT